MMKNFLSIVFFFVSFQAISQWTKVDIPTNASFRAIRSLGKHIWISGTQGTVGHSADGGINWKITQVPQATKIDFRDLAILSEQEIILMSAGLSEEGKALLFQTIDAGKNWSVRFQVANPGYFFDCIQWDSQKQKGWLLSDPIKQSLTLFEFSKDTILQVGINSSPTLQAHEAFFAASGSSMQSINHQLIMVGGGADSLRIFQYNIPKGTWTISPLQIQGGEAKGYFSVGAKNKKHLWAVGGDYRKLNESSIPIIQSKDGGNHWLAISNTPTFYMEKVIWAKPYWIVSGPSQSAAYHEPTKRWRSLGNSSYHNIIQVGNVIWGVGAKGQLGYISLSSIDHLFLTEK